MAASHKTRWPLLSLAIATILLPVYAHTTLKMVQRSRSTSHFDQIPDTADLFVAVPLFDIIAGLFVRIVRRSEESRFAVSAALWGLALLVAFSVFCFAAWGP